MVASFVKHEINEQNSQRVEMLETLVAAGASEYARFQDKVTVQLSGTATAITAVVQRSSIDPSRGTANWAPVEDTTFSGDLSAGISPRRYVEPAVGWWRLNITSMPAGNCTLSMIGETA